MKKKKEKKYKRILIITTDAYGSYGGIALYNRQLIQSILELHGEINIKIDLLMRTKKHKVDEIPDNVNIDKFALNGKMFFSLRSIVKSFSKYDLIICGHINLLPLAFFSRLLRGGKLVLMTYGIEVWKNPGFMRRFLVGKVDALWSISNFTVNKMKSWVELSPLRLAILPNALDAKDYGIAEKNRKLSEKYSLEGCVVLLTLCRLPGFDRYKGVDEVIEVLKEVNVKVGKCKYLIIGSGEDRRRLEKKVENLGVSHLVHFTGEIRESEKADHLRLADLFVMPGRCEGFGYVYLEALACGVPVLGSKLDGSREALMDGKLGLLTDPRNRGELINSILEGLKRPTGVVPKELEEYFFHNFKKKVCLALEDLDKKFY